MSFPRYPEYKNSGVEWLGEVPGHWTVTPLKYVARFRSGGTPSKDRHAYWEGSIPWASSKDMKSEALSETIDHITELAIEEGAAALLPAGTVVVVVRGMILARAFPVALTEAEISINQDLKALEATGNVLAAFLAWYLRGTSDESLRRLDEAAHGTKALRMEAWASLPVSFPDIEEQVQIAAFLDRETAKIDALVAEQQNLIALLKEKRQALISHAVTKGLDPDVPMKDSGVAWLGEVPAHWHIKPLMRLTEPGRPIMYGIVLPGPDVLEGVPIVKGGNVKPSRLRLDALARTTAEIEAPYARARLRAGDLVYAIRGTIGDCEIVPPDLNNANITQDVARVALSDQADNRWARYALLSDPLREELACGSLGAAVRGVNIFDLKRVRVPTPPLDEQVKIADALDAETASIEALIVEAECSTGLLQERRTALISAAVTGKIDVRHLAVATADATPEPA